MPSTLPRIAGFVVPTNNRSSLYVPSAVLPFRTRSSCYRFLLLMTQANYCYSQPAARGHYETDSASDHMTKVITMTARPSISQARSIGVRDRRYTIRYPFAADAELIDMETGKHVTGVTSDISLGGCFVCTSKALPVGTRARLRLTRKDQFIDVLVVVRIVKTRVGLGLEFFDLEHPNDRQLSSWIESLRRTR